MKTTPLEEVVSIVLQLLEVEQNDFTICLDEADNYGNTRSVMVTIRPKEGDDGSASGTHSEDQSEHLNF